MPIFISCPITAVEPQSRELGDESKRPLTEAHRNRFISAACSLSFRSKEYEYNRRLKDSNRVSYRHYQGVKPPERGVKSCCSLWEIPQLSFSPLLTCFSFTALRSQFISISLEIPPILHIEQTLPVSARDKKKGHYITSTKLYEC